MKIRIIIGMILLIITFIGGWIMPEIYPNEYFENGQTHAWGLKFMPPCLPFGANVSCGFDILLIIWLLICFAIIV